METAVGVTFYNRTKRLHRFLGAIPDDVHRVYVADNSPAQLNIDEVWNDSYRFDLIRLRVSEKGGIGAGRKKIVEASNEEYLLMSDSDIIIPDGWSKLLGILKKGDALGGVAGGLYEPKQGQVRYIGQDFESIGSTLIRDPHRNSKQLKYLGGNPLIHFDLVQNISLFRRQCLEEYCWDDEFDIAKDHVDFFLGHWKKTDWKFGMCPEVLFEHHPGGDRNYSSRRHDKERKEYLTRYYLDKWGFDDVDVFGYNWMTIPPSHDSLIAASYNHFRRKSTVYKPLYGILNLIDKKVVQNYYR